MSFFITAILSSGFLCLALIASAPRARWLTRRNDLGAVQASHTRQVSRLGGVGIIAGAAAAIFFLPDAESRHLATTLFLSALPIFAAGLAEDLGYGVSPKRRLGAAAISSVLAIVLTGTWIRASGLPGLDAALALLPVGLAITVLWTSGLCHATNLIDGVNGLASSFAALAALGLAGLAWTAGDGAMMSVALLMVPAILGFLVFNWPRGLIFLGDAGAYTLGHLLAWIGIVLAWRNPDVTGIAVALIFFWPIADTLFAIYRRRRLGKPFDQPDRMHVHQVAMRWLEIAGLGRNRRHISNPATTVVLLPFMAPPIFLAAIMPNRPLLALATFVLCGAGFVTTYVLGARFARARRNPVDVVRLPHTVPVSDEAVPDPTPVRGQRDGTFVIAPLPDVRIIQYSRHTHWHAYVRGPNGNWRHLQRSFSSSARAYRAAMRIRFRHRITKPNEERESVPAY